MSTTPFEGVGTSVGLKIWRVKNFSLVEEQKQHHGQFYSGDCYLVLDTFQVDGNLRHHIHFWLGKESTLDEAGSVAIFAAQLDEALGGGPVQFRQPQGMESPEFLRLFPHVKYVTGGHPSGFKDGSRAAREALPVRLYQIRSPHKTCVQVFEVPCVLASLNHGDCFLLEDPSARQMWLWHGSGANIREKRRALEAGNSFKEGTGIKLCVLDDGDVDGGEAVAFFNHLGCTRPPPAAEIKPAQSDTTPPEALAPPQLLQVLDGGSRFAPLTPSDSRLLREMLAPNGQFVLQAGGCVWVWTGQDCDMSSADGGGKAAAPLQVGDRFIAQQGLPAHTVVRAVRARFEPGLFTTYFEDWGPANGGNGGDASKLRDTFGNRLNTPGRGTDEVPYNGEEAAAAMVALAAEAEPGGGGGEGASRGAAADSLETAYGKLASSKVQVWVMTSTTSIEVPRPEVGQLYDGAAYVVLHTFSIGAGCSQPRYAVYTWVGRQCGSLEAGTAALTAADLHRGRCAGRSTLVRVEPGLEPAHFVRLFKGTLIVRRGSRPANLAQSRSSEGVHLFKVKGEAVAMAHAVEVPPVATTLNSGDCFVLENCSSRESEGPAEELPAAALWLGVGSSEAEQQTAAAVAGVLAGGQQGVARIEEGSEPEYFWRALGGKTDYPSSPAARGGLLSAPVRLFHLRDCAGRGLKVELHMEFSQDSLVADDVMVLDVGTEAFIWYGASCKLMERPRARDVVARFLSATKRESSCPVVEVEQGQEPPFFTSHFPSWDAAALPTPAALVAERLRNVSL